MQVTFKKVKLHNFMSYEDAEIILDTVGFTRILGVNKFQFDNSKSNGAGKSGIIESLSFALLGETIRGTKLINRIDPFTFEQYDCEVELSFDLDGHDCKIIRRKSDNKQSAEFYVDGEDMSGKGFKETNEAIKRYLGDLTPKLFGSVIVLGQGMPCRFSNDKPAGRKQTLEELSKSDLMITDLKERVAARKADLAKDLQNNSLKIQGISSQIATYEKTIEQAKLALNSLVSPDKVKAEVEKLVEDIAQKTDEIDKLTTQHKELTAERELKVGKWKELNDQLNEIRDKEAVAKEKITSEGSVLMEGFLAQKFQLNAAITTLEGQIQNIKNTPNSCPTCHRRYESFTPIDTSEMEASVSQNKTKLTEVLEKISAQNRTQSDAITAVVDANKAHRAELQRELDDINKEGFALRGKLDDIQAKIKTLSSKVAIDKDTKTSKELIISEYNSKHQLYTEQITNYTKQLVTLNDELVKEKETTTEINNHADVIKKFETYLSRDFRGILLDGVIQFINTAAEQYSKIMFNDRVVSLELDGNDINIMFAGKQYENLSGGEQQKVNFILQFALRDMLQSIINFSSNILVIDEGTDNLDKHGAGKLIELLTTKLEDVSSLYFISHHSDLDLTYDNTITVIKDERGISSIE